MKITCDKNQLKEKVIIAERVASKSNLLPILNTLLLSTEKNYLKITSTNLEIGLETYIPAKIEKEGAVAVPAKILSGFLITLPENDKILLEGKNQNLLLSTKKISTNIKGYPIDEFPVIPSIKKNYSLGVPLFNFITGIKSVYHAASFSDIKPEIASVFIEGKKNESLKFAATDSFRLAEKKINNIIPDFNFSLIIPQRSAGEILRIFNNDNNEIKIVFDKNQIMFFNNNLKFISKIIEGIFPDYNQVIPKAFKTELVVNKNSFINSVKNASIFTSRLNDISLNIIPSENLCIIKTSNADLGEYESEIPIKAKGDNVLINLNYNYLLSGVQSIISEELFLGLSDNNRPMIIKGADDSSYISLVMPMKNTT